MGAVSYGPTVAETKSLLFRRSLYIVEELKAGEKFTEKNVRAIRPGYGLSPKYIDIVFGMRCKRNLKKGMPLSWEMIG